MVKKKTLHSFVKQYLSNFDFEIYQGKKRILYKPAPDYRIALPDTKLTIGHALVDINPRKKITDYTELNDLGFGVVTLEPIMSPTGKILHILATTDRPTLQNFPANVYVELDRNRNKIRLIGRNTSIADFLLHGEWVDVEQDVQSQKKKLTYSWTHDSLYTEDPQNILDTMYRKWLNIEVQPEDVHIPELPAMFSENAELVCIPKSKDQPVMGFFGIRSSGKCIDEETLIYCNRIIKKIKDVEPGDEIVSINKNFRTEFKKVIYKEFSGEQELYEINVGNRKVRASKDHKFITKEGLLQKLGELKQGDLLPVVIRLPQGIKFEIVNKKLYHKCTSDVCFMKIKSIKSAGKKRTYDIQVESNANFMLANGLITHNSLMMHAIVDRAFWKPEWKIRPIIWNDINGEVSTWCLPSQNENFNKKLLNLNEYPMPLPTVYLHPNTEDIDERDDKLYYPDEVGYRVSFPFKEMVENHHKYFRFGGTSQYFEKFKHELKRCKSLRDIDDVLTIAEDKKMMQKQSRVKIMTWFETMFRRRILDVNTDIPSKWNIKRQTYDINLHPFAACLWAGVVPVLETENIHTKEYFPWYFRYFAEDIFHKQTNDAKFRGIETWWVIDEIANISSTEERTVASEILKRAATEGRPRNIGMLMATTNLSKVEPRTRSQINYLFTFQNQYEADAIGKLFNLSKEHVKVIKGGREGLGKFECLAMTSEKFVVYNKKGERRETRGPIRGWSLMPLSHHRPPGKEKKFAVGVNRMAEEETEGGEEETSSDEETE